MEVMGIYGSAWRYYCMIVYVHGGCGLYIYIYTYIYQDGSSASAS